jgi:small nuclear ribonucleoprotein (snRNP)-like protein
MRTAQAGACGFSISDAVYDTAQPFEAVAKSNGKELEIKVEDNLTYRGDEYSIRRLVSLLLDNAMKY